MIQNPFKVTIYSKTYARLGWIGNPVSLTVNPRHNVLGTATMVMDADHPRISDLLAGGARAVIEYRGEHIIGGPIRARSGKGPAKVATVTFGIEDDYRLVHRVLGWPNPTGAITAQGAVTAYDVKSGPAETVVKWFIGRAATRLGLPVTLAPDLGRGSTITVQMRMHPLSDRLYPAVDLAGIGITVKQSGAGLLVDCYTPVTRTQVLSEASGVLVDWEWSNADPSATRVVMAGQGEGTAREFALRTDTAREAAFGDVVEVFGDARDVALPADLLPRGDLLLADGAPKYGLKLTLAETDAWGYGKSVRVGDKVTAQIGPAATVTDVLREAVLQWDREGGLTVTPQVGDRTDDPDRKLATAVAAIGRGLRQLQRR